ncbi:MAG: glutamate synthase central domain-containing protein, partial [Propioniciclava sp.]
MNQLFPHRPDEGLYRHDFEHDACGVAFVAHLSGTPTHEIVAQGLLALENLDHRGATGADERAGDGAGMLLQVPDALFRDTVDFYLPPEGEYAAGIAFLPQERVARAAAKRQIEYLAIEEGLRVIGWRAVPTHDDTLSPISRAVMPYFEQLFVTGRRGTSGIDLDRAVYPLRKRAEHEAGVYFASLSARTVVYKGMLTTQQLGEVFDDLSDERTASALVLVHSRFSTNTFPSWERAHPYRLLAHNGEINTVKGNRNWMRAREALLSTDLIPGNLDRLFPICNPEGSDSASFDEVLELLHLGGRSLPHAVLMMIPEAWENNAEMDAARRDFYSFHSSVMEPWDGPAAVCFTDGTQIGATLDRNGLRPGRYWVTDDGLVVFASEAGVLPIEPERIVQKGRLQPGRMLLVDLAEHRLINDDEIKSTLASAEPYGDWIAERLELSDLPERQHVVHSHASVTRRQQVFGFTHEELKMIVAPMAQTGAEPIGSMGSDTPLAVLSDRPRLLFDYFIQLFAQVTNPPLDAIREELVTSLRASFGPEANLLSAGPESCHQIVIGYPVLDSDELAKLVRINRDGSQPRYDAYVVRGVYRLLGGPEELERRLEEICAEVSAAIDRGCRTIILSDRHSNIDMAPIPSLLLTAAVHHHLVRDKTRTQVGLIVEAGDVREVHHVALLIGYGAAAVNPYLVFESAEDLARNELYVTVDPDEAIYNVRKALGKGVL